MREDARMRYQAIARDILFHETEILLVSRGLEYLGDTFYVSDHIRPWLGSQFAVSCMV